MEVEGEEKGRGDGGGGSCADGVSYRLYLPVCGSLSGRLTFASLRCLLSCRVCFFRSWDPTGGLLHPLFFLSPFSPLFASLLLLLFSRWYWKSLAVNTDVSGVLFISIAVCVYLSLSLHTHTQTHASLSFPSFSLCVPVYTDTTQAKSLPLPLLILSHTTCWGDDSVQSGKPLPAATVTTTAAPCVKHPAVTAVVQLCTV